MDHLFIFDFKDSDTSEKRPVSSTSQSEMILAEYTVLEYIHGIQLSESLFQKCLGKIATALADHHVGEN